MSTPVLWKSLFRVSWLALPFFAGVSNGAGLPAHGTGSPSAGRFDPTDVDVLIRRIEAEHPEDIGRDVSGDVTSVVLRQGWASNSNLVLISTIGSVRSVGLEPTRKAEPTQEGIAALSGLTNLVDLQLACSWTLQEGVFRAACNLKHLRQLSLSAACPPTAEYNYITNLHSLTQLKVFYCTNFADEQLALVTNLPNLTRLELRGDAFSNQASNMISGMKSLTNVVIKPTRR
jgi:hypothetical protein